MPAKLRTVPSQAFQISVSSSSFLSSSCHGGGAESQLMKCQPVFRRLAAGAMVVAGRMCIAAGLFWVWFTWVQLVMLPDETMRVVWYLSGTTLVAAGLLLTAVQGQWFSGRHRR